MWPVSERFLYSLRSSHVAIFRATATIPATPPVHQFPDDPESLLLWPGTPEVVLGDLPIITGAVTIDRSGNVRRQLNLTVADQLLDPEVAAQLTPFGAEIVVERGVRYVDGVEEWVPLGVFQIVSTDKDVVGPLTITGVDRARVLIAAKFFTPRRQATADPFVAIPALAHEVLPDLPFVIDDNVTDDNGDPVLIHGVYTVEPIPPQFWDRERWDAMAQLADNRGCELYFAPDGSLHLGQIMPITTAEVWTIDAATHGVLITYSRNLTRDETFNVVKVIGQQTDGGTVWGQASDADATADPISPTIIYGPFGRVPYFETSSTVNTYASASRLATSILATKRELQRAVTMTSVPNPALEVGDVVVVVLPDGTTERHMLDNIVVPLDPGTAMTLNTRTSSPAPPVSGDPPGRPPFPPPGKPPEPAPDPVPVPPPDPGGSGFTGFGFVRGVDFRYTSTGPLDQHVDVWVLAVAPNVALRPATYAVDFRYYDQSVWPEGPHNSTEEAQALQTERLTVEYVPGADPPEDPNRIETLWPGLVLPYPGPANPPIGGPILRVYDVTLTHLDTGSWVWSTAGPSAQWSVGGQWRFDERADRPTELVIELGDHARYWNSGQSLYCQATWFAPGEEVVVVQHPDIDPRCGIVNGRSDYTFVGDPYGFPKLLRVDLNPDYPTRIVVGQVVVWEVENGTTLASFGYYSPGEIIPGPTDPDGSERVSVDWTVPPPSSPQLAGWQYLSIPDALDGSDPAAFVLIDGVDYGWTHTVAGAGLVNHGTDDAPVYETVLTFAPGFRSGVVSVGSTIHVDWTPSPWYSGVPQ